METRKINQHSNMLFAESEILSENALCDKVITYVIETAAGQYCNMRHDDNDLFTHPFLTISYGIDWKHYMHCVMLLEESRNEHQ